MPNMHAFVLHSQVAFIQGKILAWFETDSHKGQWASRPWAHMHLYQVTDSCTISSEWPQVSRSSPVSLYLENTPKEAIHAAVLGMVSNIFLGNGPVGYAQRLQKDRQPWNGQSALPRPPYTQRRWIMYTLSHDTKCATLTVILKCELPTGNIRFHKLWTPPTKH